MVGEGVVRDILNNSDIIKQSTNHPLIKNLTDCDKCPIVDVCNKYVKEGKCYFEKQRLRAATQKGRFMSSFDQKKYLEELEENLKKYEELIKYEVKPSKKDLLKLINLKMQLFEIVHGKRDPGLNVLVNNSSTMDIKKIMEGLREEKKKEEVVT